MKFKKAQGEIITTVLIILLVLAAVVIVWQVVQGTVNKGAEQVASQSNCMGLNVVVLSANSTDNKIVIRREVGATSAGAVTPTLYINGIKNLTVSNSLNELESNISYPANIIAGDKIQVSGKLTTGTICPLSPEVVAVA